MWELGLRAVFWLSIWIPDGPSGGLDPMKKPVMPSFAHYAWRKEELICWGPNQIMGLPVGGGKALWRIPYEVKYGVSITKPIYHEGIALVCGYWDGSRAIRLGREPADAKLLWKDQEKLCGLMSQPLYREGFCYLLDRRNGLTCFELKTGCDFMDGRSPIDFSGRNPQASLVWAGKEGDALSLNAEGELVFLNLSKTGIDEYWLRTGHGQDLGPPGLRGYAGLCPQRP